MSSVPTSLEPSLERDSLRRGLRAVSTAFKTGLSGLKVASFWLAIVLPFAYFPLLLGGLTGGQLVVFVALLATNALAFVLGHDYDPAPSSS
jgi:hypothetical protein